MITALCPNMCGETAGSEELKQEKNDSDFD